MMPSDGLSNCSLVLTGKSLPETKPSLELFATTLFSVKKQHIFSEMILYICNVNS